MFCARAQLCGGGSLVGLLKKSPTLSEERCASLFRGIIKSVLHCHQVRASPLGVTYSWAACPMLCPNL